MKNYISLNGKKIELTPEQVVQMQKSLGIENVKVKSIPVGDTFKIGEYEFVVLEHSKDTTAVILKDLLHKNKEFGKSNNYNGAYADDICNEFEITIAEIIGKENLIEHTVDLTSDDGLKNYGSIKRKMSLLTTDLYRRYVETLDKYKANDWWWTATAYSTPTHGFSALVKCVSPSGSIGINNYSGISGVRPVLRFVSSISVSSGE